MNQPSFITSDVCIKLEIPAIWSVLTRNFFVSREKSIFEEHTKNDTLQEIKMIKEDPRFEYYSSTTRNNITHHQVKIKENSVWHGKKCCLRVQKDLNNQISILVPEYCDHCVRGSPNRPRA